MTAHQIEILQKLEMIGNLESVVTEQKIRIEKLRTTYETLKAEHVQLKEVSMIYISLELINCNDWHSRMHFIVGDQGLPEAEH